MGVELLKDVVFSLGATPTALLGCREASMKVAIDKHDVTLWEGLSASRARKYKSGLVSYTISCSGVVMSETSGNDTKALLDGARSGATFSAKFAIGAGDSYSCCGFFENFDVTGGNDFGPATWSATFVVDGDLTVVS